MGSLLITVLTFACVSLCIVGFTTLAFDMFFRDRARVDDRLREEFGDNMRDRAKQSPLFKDLQQMAAGSMIDTPTISRRVQTILDQAGLRMTSAQLSAITVGCCLLAAVAVGLLTMRWWAGAIAAVSVMSLPMWVVLQLRRRRRDALARQLPDAFDVMSRALRAGQTVPAAFQVIATDFNSPLREEFAHCYEQQHLGIERDVALRDLARRTSVMELQIFVVALIMHGKTGGNLAELLGNLSKLLRKRGKLHDRIRALTGEGRMQAVVLIALPIVIFGAMFVLNREYAQVLLDRPMLLIGCGVSQLIGALCIRKIIDIEY